MDYSKARFLLSAPTRAQLPPDTGIEVAFAGRSNAGKSSALNALTRQKQLARVSKTPGRTQLINLFGLDDDCRLVDLPGYGYAQVSQTLRAQWQKSLADYLRNRRALRGIVLLTDIRHPLSEPDLILLDLAGQVGTAVHVVLTKADKLAFGARKQTLMKIQREMHGHSVQLLSSTDNIGLDELAAKLDSWFAADEHADAGA